MFRDFRYNEEFALSVFVGKIRVRSEGDITPGAGRTFGEKDNLGPAVFRAVPGDVDCPFHCGIYHGIRSAILGDFIIASFLFHTSGLLFETDNNAGRVNREVAGDVPNFGTILNLATPVRKDILEEFAGEHVISTRAAVGGQRVSPFGFGREYEVFPRLSC